MKRYEGSPAIIIERRKGTPDSPFSNINESLVVAEDGKVLLSEIPNELSRVIVTSTDNRTWYEIKEGQLTESAFKVDYINKLVTFNTAHVGKQLHFKYVGEGNHFYSPHSIYTKLEDGSVTETLGELIENGLGALDALDRMNEKLGEVDQATLDATSATNNANTATISANNATSEAREVITTANQKVQTMNNSIATADSKINEVTTKINAMDGKLTEATTVINNGKTQATTVQNFISNGQSVIDNAVALSNNAQSLLSETKSVGAFVLSKAYKKNNTVLNNGSTWMALKDTIFNPLPVLPATENENWRLVAQRGVDGAGSVSSVNGVQPDFTGNVAIGVPQVDGLQESLDELQTFIKKEIFTSTAGQTVFTLTKGTYLINENRISVEIGGVPQFSPTNFTETNENTITINEPLEAGMNVIVTYYSDFLPIRTDVEGRLISLEGDSLVIQNNTQAHENNQHSQKHIEVVSSIPTNLNDKGILFKVENGTLTAPELTNIDQLTSRVATVENELTSLDTNKANVSEVSNLSNQIDLLSDSVDAHKTEIATTTKLGHVKPDGATITIDSNGVIRGSNNYTLPIATETVLGGIKVDGETIVIDSLTGVASAIGNSSFQFTEETRTKNTVSAWGEPARNIDEILEPGIYYASSTFGTLGTLPGTGSYQIMVMPYRDAQNNVIQNIMQVAFYSLSSARYDIFMRSRYGSDWGSWVRVNTPLVDSLTSTSTTEAATANAVKQVNDAKAGKNTSSSLIASTNNWTQYSRVQKDEIGLVTLFIDAYGGTTARGTVIGTIPVGFRPQTSVAAPVLTFNGLTDTSWQPCYVALADNGQITLSLASESTIVGTVSYFAGN